MHPATFVTGCFDSIHEGFPWSRRGKCTFSGHFGRVCASRLIEDDAAYESGAKERRVDVAFRYSHAVDVLDIVRNTFSGTSREPRFVIDPGTGPIAGMDAPMLPR